MSNLMISYLAALVEPGGLFPLLPRQANAGRRRHLSVRTSVLILWLEVAAVPAARFEVRAGGASSGGRAATKGWPVGLRLGLLKGGLWGAVAER